MLVVALGGCTTPSPPAAPPAAPPAPPPPPPPPPPQPPTQPERAYEVWALDQADTAGDGGGTLYVFGGAALAGNASAAQPARVDLGGAARDLCLNATGSAPRRPHMLDFNADRTHAIVSFVATGHVLFLNATSRAPVGCVDVGAQAHAAVPTPDQRAVVVANQNGKLLQRIATDYGAGNFTLQANATLNLTACTTPSGAPCEGNATRPDSAPICPIVTRDGSAAFVTLRGGGLLVVDPRATPMRILAEYDNRIVHPNGCGGVEQGTRMFLTSGGGTPGNALEGDLYAFALPMLPLQVPAANTPLPARILSLDDLPVDLHGMALAQRFLWLADRHGNAIHPVDTATLLPGRSFNLTGPLSADPAPDLLDVAPSGRFVFASLRGPAPLTGNAPAVNNSVGATPGVLVIRVDQDGASGAVVGLAPLPRTGADPDLHGLRVRAL